MSLEENLMKNYEYLEKQSEYLKKQLGEFLKNKKRALHSKSSSTSEQSHEEVDSQGNLFGTSSESDLEQRQRRGRKHH